ncbi:DUF1642 domain-containing protein [Enterococcus casseliflavus]|uniref:DUF1642 domain-containing protein n=1 Tax=Enterococcus casseliflavus TaxID=37734 RepID=A0ABD5FKL6_ENTCA|nr:DUF1642 domain-containing protein [Enterococcus casseliflavus]MDT2982749.1 DUF1642 domain-containing protein [Enterococcus casseliflavus]
MNKQELLEELESNKDKCLKEAKKYEVLSWDRQIVDSKALVYMQVINWVERLDEKQKVTVPKFVATWINQCKEKATLADCLDGCYEISNGEVVSSEDFQNWVVDNENDELTAKAWMFGYEVEKEPNFIVKVGNLYLIEPLGDTSDSTIRTTWNHKNAYEFTSYDIAQTHANKFGGEVEEVK